MLDVRFHRLLETIERAAFSIVVVLTDGYTLSIKLSEAYTPEPPDRYRFLTRREKREGDRLAPAIG